jgi:hypothetical protein
MCVGWDEKAISRHFECDFWLYSEIKLKLAKTAVDKAY